MRHGKTALHAKGNRRHRVLRLVAATGVLVCGAPVRAQSSPEQAAETLRRAIVTPDAVFVPLPAEVVCGPKIEGVLLSPWRDYALIVRRNVYPTRDLESYLAQSRETDRDVREGDAGAPELQLLVWGPGSRRAATVWRWTPNPIYAYAAISKVSWLAGTDTALVQITLVPRPEKSDAGKTLSAYSEARQTQIVRIHAATGQAETIATVRGSLHLGASSVSPTALGSSDNGKTVYVIGEQGPMQRLADFPLDGNRRTQAIWAWPLADGRLGGLLRERADDGRTQWRKVAWNVKTNAVDDWNMEKDPEPELPQNPPLPLMLTHTPDTLKTASDTHLTTLWLQARESAPTERLLLTADTDTRTEPVLLETAVLYQQQGTLLAFPLVRARPAAFATLRREQDKQETLNRARSIGMYALAVALSNNKRLPEPGDFLSLLQAYASSDPTQAHLLENPTTGKPALTVAYTNPDLPTLANASTRVLAYLVGPNGRAVIYYGGTTKWEEN